MKVYYAIYENKKSKEYSSLAICKRYNKENVVKYIEKEIHYILDENLVPIGKQITKRQVK